MKVLIVEDEVLAAERMLRLLQEIDPAVHIAGTVQSIKGAVAVLQNDPQPDLILADIELGDGSFFEVFKMVQVKSAIIFTTSYNEYALQAFSANSIDYLLKPIRKADLENSLRKYNFLKQQFATAFLAENGDRLQQEIKGMAQEAPVPKTFLVKMGQRFMPVTTDEIAYFFADGRLVYLLTWDQKKWIIDHSLEELEKVVDGRAFYRANRAFLVHRRAVQKFRLLLNRKLKIELAPATGQEVLVSKEKAAAFKAWMVG